MIRQVPDRAGGPWAKALALIAAVALAEAVAVGMVYRAERSALDRDTFRSFVREGPWSDRFEYVADGLREPTTRPARDAPLSDSEEVAGVVVGGEARAYRLTAMRGRDEHVVNDLVSGVPVTVTYCDLTGCVRGFTDPDARAPLDIAQGGLKGGRMVLKAGGAFFLQESGEPIDLAASNQEFPFRPFPVTRTSWKAWREEHPETDVYIGLQNDSP